MVVTGLEAQKKNPNRLNLFVDGHFCCGVSLNIVAKYKLFNDKPIDEQTMEQLLLDSLLERILDRVIQYLSSYGKTEKQVKQYIKELLFKKKGVWFSKDILLDEDNIISRIMKFVKRNGLVDDKKYTQDYINERRSNKPRSIFLIKSELRKKGISDEIIEQVMDNLDMFDLNDEQLIVELCKKKYGVEKISKDDRKKIAFFQRKGFNWEVISSILDDI